MKNPLALRLSRSVGSLIATKVIPTAAMVPARIIFATSRATLSALIASLAFGPRVWINNENGSHYATTRQSCLESNHALSIPIRLNQTLARARTAREMALFFIGVPLPSNAGLHQRTNIRVPVVHNCRRGKVSVIVQGDICVCEVCSPPHRWLAEEGTPFPPLRCARCKSVLWNRASKRRGRPQKTMPEVSQPLPMSGEAYTGLKTQDLSGPESEGLARHDPAICRIYRCFLCRMAGVKDRRRDLG